MLSGAQQKGKIPPTLPFRITEAGLCHVSDELQLSEDRTVEPACGVPMVVNAVGKSIALPALTLPAVCL